MFIHYLGNKKKRVAEPEMNEIEPDDVPLEDSVLEVMTQARTEVR